MVVALTLGGLIWALVMTCCACCCCCCFDPFTGELQILGFPYIKRIVNEKAERDAKLAAAGIGHPAVAQGGAPPSDTIPV